MNFGKVRLKSWLIILLAFYLLYLGCAAHQKLRYYGRSLYDRVENSQLPYKIWAKSVKDRNIRLLEFGSGEKTTIIFGAFHGSEPLSAELIIEFAEYLYENHRQSLHSRVIIMPIVNPDGLAMGIRTNANGIDLNRNFPTQNWTSKYKKRSCFPGKFPASEPETIALMELIEKYQPDRIVSVHTPLEVVNFDGPARELAIQMSMFNGYPVSHDIGYPTPGSLGTFTGKERGIPTITLELPRKPFPQIWKENRDALLISVFYGREIS